MYLIDTYLGKDRLPFIEKKEICRKTQVFDSPDKIYEFLNKYFRDRVGGSFRRRPLTPPDMRFRIRRFS